MGRMSFQNVWKGQMLDLSRSRQCRAWVHPSKPLLCAACVFFEPPLENGAVPPAGGAPAPRCGSTERAGRGGEQNSYNRTLTRARTLWTHTTSVLASSRGRPWVPPVGKRAPLADWLQGLDANPGRRVQPSSPGVPMGVGPANQRVLARRRSLPTTGCRCEEAETADLTSWGMRRHTW